MNKALLCLLLVLSMYTLICSKQLVILRQTISRLAQNQEIVLVQSIDLPACNRSRLNSLEKNLNITAAELFAHRDLTMQSFKEMDLAFKKMDTHLITYSSEIDRIHVSLRDHKERTMNSFQRVGSFMKHNFPDMDFSF